MEIFTAVWPKFIDNSKQNNRNPKYEIILWKRFRPWQDSNLQSPDPKSGALSIRPHGLILFWWFPTYLLLLYPTMLQSIIRPHGLTLAVEFNSKAADTPYQPVLQCWSWPLVPHQWYAGKTLPMWAPATVFLLFPTKDCLTMSGL